MRNGPIRSKLIARAGGSPARARVLCRRCSSSHRVMRSSRGASAWALSLVMAGVALASAAKVSRRIRTLRASLAPIADPDAPPEAGCDELDALASRRASGPALRSSPRESELHRSSEFLRFAQCAGGFGIFDLDLASGQIDRRRRSSSSSSDCKRTAWPFTRDDWLATVHPRGLRGRGPARSSRHRERRANSRPSTASLTLDGGVRWLARRAVRSRAIRTGEPARLIGTITDITERKQLEESLAQQGRVAQHRAGRGGRRDHGPRLPAAAAGSARKTFHELLGVPAGDSRSSDLGWRG